MILISSVVACAVTSGRSPGLSRRLRFGVKQRKEESPVVFGKVDCRFTQDDPCGLFQNCIRREIGQSLSDNTTARSTPALMSGWSRKFKRASAGFLRFLCFFADGGVSSEWHIATLDSVRWTANGKPEK